MTRKRFHPPSKTTAGKRLRKEVQPRGVAPPAPPPPPSASLLLQDDDADFPRGGGSVLSREEAAAARAEGEAEFEREERESGKGRDKRKRKGAKTQYTEPAENDLGCLFSAGVTGRLPRFANRPNRITLKVDEERQRISLGMKKSYIGEVNDAHITSTDANNDEVDNNGTIDDTFLALQLDGNSSFTQKIPEQQENGCAAILAQAESRASVLPLQVSLGDSEDSDAENDATISQDDAKVNAVVVKRNDRLFKKKTKGERELEVGASEERCLQNDIPRTEDEFEKLVRSSPNSSFVWIKYMAFMLSLADVEKAHAIAERALKTINIREEGEKLNIWVAYFNLENEYGSPPEEAVKKTFQRALQYCDPKKLHLALLGMHERSEQFKLADELLERMTKKFKNSCKVWLHRVQSLSKQGKDGSQSVVKRALLSLPRRKHIKFISQAAILEFKCGMPDRGRSMFEGILREYPKRTDLWNVYLDQEIRLGDVELIRALFERATCLSLPPKKMKFLFKKYLEYEKSRGDDDRIEHVKRKALEYVETSLA